MAPDESHETLQQILALVPEGERKPAAEQLTRLRHQGIIRYSHSDYPTDGGSVSFYSAGTGRLFVEMRRRLKEHNVAVDVAWDLWWEGWDVPAVVVRERMSHAIDRVNVVLGLLGLRGAPRELFAGMLPEKGEKLLARFEPAANGKLPRLAPGLGAIRKRLTRQLPLVLVMRVAFRVATGRFTGYEPAYDPDEARKEREATERAFGWDRAQRDRLGDIGPWFTGDSEEALIELSTLFRTHPWDQVLRTSSDEQLLQARDEVCAVLGMFKMASTVLDQMFGPWAFGFRVLAEGFRHADRDVQALLVLVWRMLRSIPEYRAGIEVHLDNVPRWREAQEGWLILEQVRREVPEARNVVTVKEVAHALKDRDYAPVLHGRIADLRRSHGNTIDAVIADLRRERHAHRQNAPPPGG